MDNFQNYPYYGGPPPQDTSRQTRTVLLVLLAVLLTGTACLVLLWLTVLRPLVDKIFYYQINMKGNSYVAQHNYPAAIKEYTRMIDARPMKEDGYSFRGYAEYRSGLYRDAIDDYSHGLQVLSTPEGIDEIGFSSTTHAQKLQYLPALVSQLYIERGLVYDAEGRRRNAIADYTSALNNKPNDWQAHWNRGEDYRQIRQWSSALADANWVVNRYPARSSVYRQRGVIYREAGNLAAAEADFTHAIRIKPGEFQYYFLSAGAYEDAHRYPEAVAVWKRAVAALPKNGACWGDLGWTEYLAGDLEGGVDNSRKAIAIDPHSVYAWYNLGLCYATREDWPDAQTAYRQALSVSQPTDIAAGLDDIRNALKQHPSSTALHNAQSLLTTSAAGPNSRGA